MNLISDPTIIRDTEYSSFSGGVRTVPAATVARFLRLIPVDVAPDGCWPWLGALDSCGYGTFQPKAGLLRAHRLMYNIAVGPIPARFHLDHLCRVRRCVNPAHLEPVTSRENIARGLASGAQAIRTNRCKQGHEYTPENTYLKPNGCRNCLACVAERNRRAGLRRRLAVTGRAS